MSRIFLSLGMLFGLGQPLSAVSPDPKTLDVPSADLERARALVQQLGSEEFVDREDAEQALSAMGRLARVALLEGVNTSSSAEIRSRCEGLLPRATAQDTKARMEVFLADEEGKYEHDLPGWNQFRAKLCSDRSLFGIAVLSDKSLRKATKAVFVELIASPANRAVVLATGASENELNGVVINRRQELFYVNMRMGRGNAAGGMAATARQEATAEAIAALLFAESFATRQVAGRIPRQASAIALISRSGFLSAVRDTDDKGRVYKAIAAAWFESRTNPLDLSQSISLASSMGLSSHSLRMAIRLLGMADSPASYRSNAVSVLVNSGEKDHLPVLEKVFEDVGVLCILFGNSAGDSGERREIQLRDIALGGCIQLTSQNPKDYGFVDCSLNYRNAYSPYLLPAEKRSEAFVKYAFWRMKHKRE